MAKKKRSGAQASKSVKSTAANARHSQTKQNQKQQAITHENHSFWEGHLAWVHYLFLLVIFISINAFHLSGTTSGPYITDHLFVKNFYTILILMPLTVVALVMALWQTKQLLVPWSVSTKIILLLFAYAVFGLLWTQYPGFVVTKLTIWFVGLLVYFWAYDLVRRGQWPALLQVLFWSGVGVALIGLWQVYFELSSVAFNQAKAEGLSPKRLIDMAAGPSSSFGNRNMANHMIVLTAPIGIYLIFSSRIKVTKWSYFIGLAAILLFSFHTQTRSAYIALSLQTFVLLIFLLPRHLRLFAYVGSLVLALLALKLLDFGQLGWIVAGSLGVFFSFVYLFPKRAESSALWRREYFWYALIAGATALILANYSYVDSKIVPFWDVLLGRVEATANGLSANPVLDDFGNGSSNLRIQIWRDAWEVFKASPIVGHGLGTFYPAFHFSAFDISSDSGIRYAHNEVFTVLTELGSIGAIAVLALLGVLLYMLVKTFRVLNKDNYQDADRHEKQLLLVVIFAAGIGTLINSLFSFPYEYASTYVAVSCYMAILGWIYADTVKKSSNHQSVETGSLYMQSALRGWGAIAVSVFIGALAVGTLALNVIWNNKISDINYSMRHNVKPVSSFNHGAWFVHANYYWTTNAYMKYYAGIGACEVVDAIADDILTNTPDYYTARMSKASCGQVTNIDQTLLLLSEADLVSTYRRDHAWSNLLKIAVQTNKPTTISSHLQKLEARYKTRPDGVKHRYANSLGRRYFEFARKLDGEQKDSTFAKAEAYLLMAIEMKPINTKYKSDLVHVYIAQRKFNKAEALLTEIEQQNPISALAPSLREILQKTRG